MLTLLENISNNKYLSTFSKSIAAAGITAEFTGPEAYTVFAPSELAFSKLFNGELPELMQPDHREQMRALLNGHVVEGNYAYNDLVAGKKIVSVNGHILEIAFANGYITVNGATIQERDILSTNGILHSVGSLIY